MIGLEVEIDLSCDITTERAAELRLQLARHDVLIVRGGASVEEQRRFCSVFGRVLPQGPSVEVNTPPPAVPPPDVIHVSNVRADGVLGNDELGFHHEFAYLPTPLLAVSLYAEEVVDGVSGTRFVSGRLAYAALPADLRARLDRLQGLFVAQYDPDVRKALGRHRDRAVDPTYPRAVHPIVVPHPVTGDSILYVNSSQTDRIFGLSDDHSEELLQSLFQIMYDPANAYEHRYLQGDLVVWDNLNVQHGRAAGDPSIPRTLRRMTVGEKAPWEEWPQAAG